MNFSNRLRLGSLAVGIFALPFALGGVLLGPGMVGRAEGCSGAANYWYEFGWSGDTTAPTDAVVVFRGKITSGSYGPLEDPAVGVVDSNGVAVPGATSKDEFASPGTGWTIRHYVFKPLGQLDPAESYSVTWKFSGFVGPSLEAQGSVPFQVLPTPAPPVSSPSTQASFTRVHRLGGPGTSCKLSYWNEDCEYYDSFGTVELDAPTLTLTWTVKTTVSVYYSLSVKEVPGKGTLIATAPAGAIHAGTSGSGMLVMTFNDEVPEYCVRLVTQDLTDNTEAAAEVCAKASPSTSTDTPLLDAQLSQCTEPPDDPSLEKKWCALHPTEKLCALYSSGGSPSTGGTSGGFDGGSDDASAPDSSTGGASSSPAVESGGSCSVSSRRSTSWFGLGLILCVGGLRRSSPGRRREYRQRAQSDPSAATEVRGTGLKGPSTSSQSSA